MRIPNTQVRPESIQQIIQLAIGLCLLLLAHGYCSLVFGERGHKDPAWAKIYFPKDKPLQVDELLVQTDVARTLSEISRDGSDAFYDGRVAKSICRTFEEKGGCLGLEDFHEHQSVWETPIHCAYMGYDVYVPPPNSYGLSFCFS